MNEPQEKAILDLLAEELGCMFLSDLLFLDEEKRSSLANIIRRHYPAESASLHDWNNALTYLTGHDPENTAAAARDKLTELLER